MTVLRQHGCAGTSVLPLAGGLLQQIELFNEARRLELFFEAKNLFNTENVSAVTRDVTTDAFGVLSTPLPSPFPPQSAYDQRQMQLGVKFTF